jgi:two-component system, NtrC family, sensor kinase
MWCPVDYPGAVRLRTKLLFLFLASGGFLLIEGLVASYSLSKVGQDVEGLQRYTQTDDICAQVKAELARLPDFESLESGNRARRNLLDHADRVLILCRSLEKLTTDQDSRTAIARVTRAVREYRRHGKVYARAAREGAAVTQRTAAQEAYIEIERLQEEGVIEPVGHEARLATKAVVRRTENLNRWITVGGLSLALLLTVVSAIALARITAQPIVRLARAARDVGRGDLSTFVEVRSDDELGQLTQAFNDMTSRLREVYDGLEAEVRKRTAELRLREADLERERRLAAVGRLAAGVAHEVSNPLTVIAGAAEGLRDRAQDPSFQGLVAFEDFPEYLETIETEAYRLKKVVRRLLNFSRTRPSQMLPLDLTEVVQDAASLAELDPGAKGHPIRLELSPPLPVRGDPDALKETLLNLLFNSIKAVADGGDVRVRAWARDERVLIEVSDTGCGIEPADLERIFEPFFTTRREGEGTGLGLALVYGTIERHGGTISVHSDGPGRGTTFRISLPEADGSASLILE